MRACSADVSVDSCVRVFSHRPATLCPHKASRHMVSAATPQLACPKPGWQAKMAVSSSMVAPAPRFTACPWPLGCYGPVLLMIFRPCAPCNMSPVVSQWPWPCAHLYVRLPSASQMQAVPYLPMLGLTLHVGLYSPPVTHVSDIVSWPYAWYLAGAGFPSHPGS